MGLKVKGCEDNSTFCFSTTDSTVAFKRRSIVVLVMFTVLVGTMGCAPVNSVYRGVDNWDVFWSFGAVYRLLKI